MSGPDFCDLSNWDVEFVKVEMCTLASGRNRKRV